MVSVEIKVPNWLDRICVWPVMVYRRWKYGYPYRRIYLGEGRFAIVDPQDYYWLNKFHWYLTGVRGKFYAVRSVISGSKTRIISMHREIKHSPKGLLVDHRNCNTFDNRNDNLRVATKSQNSCNKFVNKTGKSSQYRGVSWDKYRHIWKSQLKVKGKYVFFGRFDNELDAAKAYDEAAKKYHGEFARLNFPEKADLPQKSPFDPVEGMQGNKFSFLLSLFNLKKFCALCAFLRQIFSSWFSVSPRGYLSKTSAGVVERKSAIAKLVRSAIG